MANPGFGHMRRSVAAIAATLAVCCFAALVSADHRSSNTLAIHITSPLGRTGLPGPIRIVAQVQRPEKVGLAPVDIYIDGRYFGQAVDGPPFALEWTDENPFEARDISAQVCDDLGECASDAIHLEPLTITEVSGISSVLVEASVKDETGHYVAGLTGTDFQLTEDDVSQHIDVVSSEIADSTYTLLIDSSQSMSRRMDFVQETAARLVTHLRKNDRVIVAPFTKTIGAITGPTVDRATVANAIGSTRSGGGTALIDALAQVPQLVEGAAGRQAVVLITDGYDENSSHSVEDALRGIKAAQATLYVVGIGGVAGISIKGERILRSLAEQSGGRAFFPSRDEELPSVNDLIVADVQHRYLIGYTPENQASDGAWRRIGLKTTNVKHVIRSRPGYFAPKPPPVRATIEFVAANEDHQPVAISAEDLEFTEDGVKQSVDTFQEAVAPISIILALDASGSMRAAADAVRDAAKSFVRALRPSDQLALVVFSDESTLVHDLTTNRQWTTDAIDQYKARGGTALYDALFQAIARLNRAEGRKAIVMLTDGRDENNPGTAPGSRHTLDDVMTAVHDVDVTLFSIGLGPKVDRELLEKVAEVSGGESFFPASADELPDQYRRVIDHLRQRYIASYISTNGNRDGGWRHVTITPHDPTLKVSSRSGYFAPER
jgi:Ca-activated chloride channel homolog